MHDSDDYDTLSTDELARRLREAERENRRLAEAARAARLENAEAALRESEARYRHLFENMAEEVHLWEVVRDAEGTVRTWRLVDANPPALATWGCSSVEEIRGKATDEIFGAGAAEHYLPVVQRIMTERVPHSFDDYFPHLDKHFRFTSVPLGDTHFITTGADITAVKQAHEALQRSERRNALLSEVAARLLLSDDPQALLEDLCHRVMEVLDCQVFLNFLVEPDGDRLFLNACAGIPSSRVQEIQWLDFGVGGSGWVAREQKRLVVEDVQRSKDPRAELIRPYGIQAYCCHPLRVQDQVLGTLSFGTRMRAHFSGDDIAVMETVSDLVAIALQRIATAEALRQSHKDLDRAQDVGQMGWWRLDTRRNRLTWSEQTYRLFDIAPGTPLTYESFLECIHPEDRAAVDSRWQQTLGGGEPFDVQYRIVIAGKVRWLRGKAYLEHEPDGSLRGGFGIVQDITAAKRAEQALREADRRKDAFLATLGHELRNPLAPIRNACAILRLSDASAPNLAVARDIIDRQVSHLARLVDDLLDVSRITRGKLQLYREHVELAAVLERALEVTRPMLDGAGHTLEMALPLGSIELDADLMRLSQVFANLLSNASKFTPPGGHIRLTVADAGAEVMVEVADTGIGIPAEHLPHLFEMFHQVPAEDDRVHAGLGIGLALVQGLVAMHGGRVTAHSEGLGKGSAFRVYLPVTAVKSPPAATAAETAEPPADVIGRVLVVDDQADVTDSLAMLLRLQGVEVETGRDGQEAIEAAERFRPDLVLLDLGMPRLDGVEACRRIRAQPWGRDLTIVAVTGWGQDSDRQRSTEAGFDDHRIKPVAPADVLELLASARLRRRGIGFEPR